MKNVFYISLIAVFTFVLTTGFQCGSPELTSAKLYMNQKNWDKALESAEKEVKNNPKSVEGWYIVGQLKGEKKDYKGMVEAFKQCLAVDPVTHKKDIEDRFRAYWAQAFNSGVANFNKGRSEDKKEFFDKSINDFHDATIIFPDSMGSYWNLASAYSAKGDQGNAIKVYSQIAEKTKDPQAYINIANAYVEKGIQHKNKFDAENKDKVELKNKFDQIEKKVSKETVRKNFGEPDEIIKPEPPKKGKKKPVDDKKEEWIYKKYNLHIFFEKDKDLVESKKFDPPYEINIDSTEYALAVKEWDVAIAEYIKARDVAPDSLKIRILEQLTQLYTSTNKLDIAIKSYEELVKQDPSNKNYHYVLGVLYLNDKRFDDATARLRKVIDLDPNDEKSYYSLYVIYNNWAIKVRDEANASGKDDTTYLAVLRQALPFVQKLNEMKPDNLEYIEHHRSLCSVFQMKSDLEKILEKLKNMESKQEDNPYYWEIIAKTYTSMNKVNEAMKAYDKADSLRKPK